MSSCIADGRESIGKLTGTVQLRRQTWRSSLRVKIGPPTAVLFEVTQWSLFKCKINLQYSIYYLLICKCKSWVCCVSRTNWCSGTDPVFVPLAQLSARGICKTYNHTTNVFSFLFFLFLFLQSFFATRYAVLCPKWYCEILRVFGHNYRFFVIYCMYCNCHC